MSATGRSDVRHADDFYATPAWVTRAILPHVIGSRRDLSVLDPACGNGAILDVAWRHSQCAVQGIEIDDARASEARSRGFAIRSGDALGPNPWPRVDAIVMNPPFALAMEFVQRALMEARGADVVALLRIAWLAAQKRAQFHIANPSDVYVLPRRPSFTGKGTDSADYAWFAWGPNRGGRWSILDVAEAA